MTLKCVTCLSTTDICDCKTKSSICSGKRPKFKCEEASKELLVRRKLKVYGDNGVTVNGGQETTLETDLTISYTAPEPTPITLKGSGGIKINGNDSATLANGTTISYTAPKATAVTVKGENGILVNGLTSMTLDKTLTISYNPPSVRIVEVYVIKAGQSATLFNGWVITASRTGTTNELQYTITGASHRVIKNWVSSTTYTTPPAGGGSYNDLVNMDYVCVDTNSLIKFEIKGDYLLISCTPINQQVKP